MSEREENVTSNVKRALSGAILVAALALLGQPAQGLAAENYQYDTLGRLTNVA